MRTAFPMKSLLEKVGVPEPWHIPVLSVAGAALLLALGLVLKAFPGLPLLLITSLLAWLCGRNLREMKKRVVLAILPALSGFLLAWLAAFAVHEVQDIARIWNPQKYSAPPPVVWSSWLEARPLSNPANRAGRACLWVGAIMGLFAALWLGRKLSKASHGPGMVQGEKVVKGGWANEAHVAGRLPGNARFGPPRPGDGGIVLGKVAPLDGPPDPGARILRLLPGPGGFAFHGAWLGASGAGKTFGFVMPNIVSAVYEGCNLVVTDPKGELAVGKWVPGKNGKPEYLPGLAGWIREQGYKVYILNFKDPAKGTHRWNPLWEARDEAEFRFTAETMIFASGKDNPFFSGGEVNLFTALMGLVRYTMDPPYRHLRAALSVLAWPLEAIDLVFEEAYRSGKLPFFYYEKWKAAKPIYANFMAGVHNKLAELTEGALARMLAGHDLSMEELGGPEKVALFVILPTVGDLRPVLACFYAFLFKRLAEKADFGQLPRPVRCILDEFPNLGYIPNFPKRITFDRGIGINYHIVLQSLKQLAMLYGPAEAETILNSCDIQVALRVNDMATASYFAKQVGEAETLHVAERRNVTRLLDRLEPPQKTETVKRTPLLYPWQLRELPLYSAVALIPTCRPLPLKTVSFAELEEFRKLLRVPQTIAHFAPMLPEELPLPPLPQLEGATKNNQDGESLERARGREKSIPSSLADGYIDPGELAAEELGI